MKKNILFLGSSEDKLEHYLPAKRLGCLVTVIKPNPKEEDYKNFDFVICADLFNVDEVLLKLDEFISENPIHACVTRFEPLVPLLGYLCDKYGFVGPNFESCMNARDKLLMRRKLKEFNVPQPEFYEVNNLDELKSAALKLGYPFILKPISGAKSRFIQKVNSENELEKCFDIAYNGCMEHDGNLFRNYSFDMDNSFRNTFLAEECIVGKQVTTTSFIVNDQIFHLSVADLITGQDVGVNAFYLISRTTPSVLPFDVQEDICKISSMGIKALGVNNTALHPELILTSDGPKIIEIAARVGGYRTEMTKDAFGIDLNEVVVKIALGEDVDFVKKFVKASTAIEVWPLKSGELMSDLILEGDFSFVKINNKKGSLYQVPPHGEKPVGCFVYCGESSLECEKEAFAIMDRALDNLQIKEKNF